MKQRYRYLSIAAAISTAWMWSLPLFGMLQGVVALRGETAAVFSLIFLAGNVAGYCGYAKSSVMTRRFAATVSPLVNASLMLLLLLSSNLSVPVTVVYFIAGAMGVFSAALSIHWAVSIADTSRHERGRYSGAMLSAASLLYAVGLLAFNLSPQVTYAAAAVLLMGAWLAARLVPDRKEGAPTPRATDRGGRVEPVLFSVLFVGLLVGYYSLSWMSHQTIFCWTGEGGGLAPAVAALAYGVVALLAGTVIDATGEMESVAMVGLAILIGTFMLMVPAARLGLKAALDFALQSSYGILDVFVFICLAAMSSLLNRDPRHLYAYGLSINALVVASGYLWAPELDPELSYSAITTLSPAIAGALITGTVCAIILRGMRLSWQQAHEDESEAKQQAAFDAAGFTDRERDVARLILKGHTNQDIADQLKISINTVKTHIRNLYSKANVSSRTDFILKMHDSVGPQ